MRNLRLDPIYPITTTRSLHGLNHLQLSRSYVAAEIGLFQVRDKLLEDSVLYEQLLRIAELCNESNTSFLVNDRVDLALASGAAGVHLGQTDVPAGVARRILGPDALIGISTHTREQFQEAQGEDVDYVALGPIFRTTTKESRYKPLGIEELRDLARYRRLPLVAIGGISIENVRDVWAAGADSVAVVSDVTNRRDPTARIFQYMDEWSRC